VVLGFDRLNNQIARKWRQSGERAVYCTIAHPTWPDSYQDWTFTSEQTMIYQDTPRFVRRFCLQILLLALTVLSHLVGMSKKKRKMPARKSTLPAVTRQMNRNKNNRVNAIKRISVFFELNFSLYMRWVFIADNLKQLANY